MDFLTRRDFVLAAAAAPVFAGTLRPSAASNSELRARHPLAPSNIPRVALHRAQASSPRSSKPRKTSRGKSAKAMALREYFRTVPLYLRPGDRLAGSISETPGAMPLMAELGFGESGTDINPAVARLPQRQSPAGDLGLLEDAQPVGPLRRRQSRTARAHLARLRQAGALQVHLQPGPPEPELRASCSRSVSAAC